MSANTNRIDPTDMEAVWADFDRVRSNREKMRRATLGTRESYINRGFILPNDFRLTPLVKTVHGEWVCINPTPNYMLKGE